MIFVEWDEYTKLLEEVYQKVYLRKFDGIVAIGRGGCIIGAYLASKLGIPTFCPVFVRHVGRGPSMKVTTLQEQITALNGNLLVVDDWLCDGRAMSSVLELLPKSASITTLVLVNRRGSKVKPDIVGKYVENDEREVMFPYGTIG